MANEQAWQDFKRITRAFMIIPGKINEIHNQIERLKELKQEILDDATRKAEMKKIIDIHPLYTIANLQADYQKIIALQAFLENNGYL